MTKIMCKKIISACLAICMLCLAFGAVPASAGNHVMERLLVDITPKITVSPLSGTELEIEALAAPDAKVTAEINGTRLSLSATTRREGTAVWYSGSFSVPSVNETKDLGRILFSAEKNGRTEQRNGGRIRAAAPKKNVEVDKPAEGGGSVTPPRYTVSEWPAASLKAAAPASGDIIRISKDYTDIYSSIDRGEEYAAPYYFNLPQDTMDYSIGITNTSYILKSGRRVPKNKAKFVKNGTNGNNKISSMTAANDGTFTILNFKQSWPVPFNVKADPVVYPGSSNTVSSCTPERIEIIFDYTDHVAAGSVKLSGQGAFRSASWKMRMNGDIPQAVLTLELNQVSGFYGTYADYDAKGNLTLKFLNPVNSLKGARIVLDAGHGTGDPGNTVSGVDEAVVNLRYAIALKKELEARGAIVNLLETRGDKYIGVTERAQMAIEWMPHIYISIHQNSASPDARGVETYYNTPHSYRLAKHINDSLFTVYQKLPYASGARDRGAKFSEYAVTRTKQFASVLVEYGFLSNKQEAELLLNPAYDPEFTNAAADGIARFFSGK